MSFAPPGGIDPVGLKNTLGISIDPATEDTLSAIASGLGTTTTVVDGSKDVAVAGTAVPLSATSVPIGRVIVTAKEGNTGVVVVGASTVVALAANRRGTPLTPLTSVDLTVNNLNKVYIDAENANDGVTFTYFV